MVAKIKALVAAEPVLVAAVVASAVVTVAQVFGIVLDEQSVVQYVYQAIVIVGLAGGARSQVSPV